MTDEELKKIEERAAAASKGPWHSTLSPLDDVNLYACVCEDESSENVILAVDTGEEVSNFKSERRALSSQERKNADFVAHARQDIPQLLSEIQSLRSSLKSARLELGKFRTAKDASVEEAHAKGLSEAATVVKERDWFRSECNRLKTELTEAVKTSTSVAMTLSIFASEIQDVRGDLANVIDSAPCLVSRPGETTYECDIRKPCRVCEWRNDMKRKLSGF